MAPHSSTLAWKIPWMEEPGRLQSMGSLSDFTFTFHSHALEGNGNPLQCSSLENPRDGGAWRAAVYGVAQSRTRLKRLSRTYRAIWFYYRKHLFQQKSILILLRNSSFVMNLLSRLTTNLKAHNIKYHIYTPIPF